MANEDNRYRNYFLTIFENAKCYESLDLIIQQQSNCTYAYITHDKDIDENGEPKSKHVHLVLAYKNDRTFETIQNTFKGAHIEKVLTLEKSVQYLTHKNDQDKHQYKFNDIISNDVSTIKAYYDAIDYPLLNEQIIVNLIVDFEKKGEKLTLVYFYMVYGNKQTIKYRQMIKDLLYDTSTVLQIQSINDIVNDV